MGILCVHIETSSLWAEFVNKNIFIIVRYPRRLKPFNFDNYDDSRNSFLLPEYFIDFLCERWIPCQASTSVLCLHYRPKYTAVQKMRTPLKKLSLHRVSFWKPVLKPGFQELGQADLWKSILFYLISSYSPFF